MRLYRLLLVLATLVTLCVISLGAYVRLSDAGLGCPDWPGCYGHLIGVPDAPHEMAAAEQRFPDQPVEAAKAWKEMAHRYLAGTLGLLIAAIAFLAWKHRRAMMQSPALPITLLGVVAFQALLGDFDELAVVVGLGLERLDLGVDQGHGASSVLGGWGRGRERDAA